MTDDDDKVDSLATDRQCPPFHTLFKSCFLLRRGHNKHQKSNRVEPLLAPAKPSSQPICQQSTNRTAIIRSAVSESDLAVRPQQSTRRNTAETAQPSSSKTKRSSAADQQLPQQKKTMKSTGSLNMGIISKTLSPLLHHRRQPVTDSQYPPLTPQQQLIARTGQLRLWIGTWNVNGQIPPQDLSPLLERPKQTGDDDKQKDISAVVQDYEIIVFGTQECAKSIERSVMFPSKELWEQRLKQYLGNQYEMVASETLVALHIAVFVHRDLLDYVAGVQQGSVATGIGNMLGNKGGVGIGLSFGPSAFTILFISSHFTGKSGNVIEMFDYVFWCGDLNYRVNGTRKMVDSVLHNRMQEVLLANDQLRIEMRRRNVFAGFQEAEITFQPTYKYQVDKRRRKSDPALQQQPAGSRKSNANNLGRSKTINSATPTSRKGTASTVSPPSTANSASSDDDDDDDADDDDYDDSEDNSNDKQATEAITTITDKRRSDTSMVAQSSGDGKTNNSNALRRPQRITKPSSSQIQKSNGTTTAAKRHQQYDNSPKQRIPSWTDRILWRDNNRHRLPNLAGGIRAEKYDCCMRMRQSDHKPVYGVFTVQVNWDKMVEERNQRQRPTKKSTDSCKIL